MATMGIEKRDAGLVTLGIELCDAGFLAASIDNNTPCLVAPSGLAGAFDWPGFAHYDGSRLIFGREAEDAWFVHPRQVSHVFWERLSHESSALGTSGKPAPLSELAFAFLRDYVQRLGPSAQSGNVVLAVPGGYLKDAATEDEKIGLLLGMASELKLPLVRIVDEACASLCDPRSPGINPVRPVVFIDLHLHGADLSLLRTENGLVRRTDFLHLAQAGVAQLLKHLTATMGNRFLRQTAFDILEDGRIEQTFFRQTKDFLLSGAQEFRFQINTARRNYELIANREQLVSDSQAFESALLNGVLSLLHKAGLAQGVVSVALSARAACLPGFEGRLRSAGFLRSVRLAPGAAACGAARLGVGRQAAANLADVPVDCAVPIGEVTQSHGAPWEALLHKVRLPEPRAAPSHVILDGIGHSLGGNGIITVGPPRSGANVTLPIDFDAAEDCLVRLERSGGRLWMVEGGSTGGRAAVDAGDRLTIRSGALAADLLFASFRGTPGA